MFRTLVVVTGKKSEEDAEDHLTYLDEDCNPNLLGQHKEEYLFEVWLGYWGRQAFEGSDCVKIFRYNC